VENNEKRTGHCAKSQEALSKVANPLFYYMIGDSDGLALVCVIFIGYLAGDAERSGVEWSLRDKSIGEWNAKKSRNKCGESEQPEIPVKASRFPKRELCALSDERRDWRTISNGTNEFSTT
jgi:hypothetical protein